MTVLGESDEGEAIEVVKQRVHIVVKSIFGVVAKEYKKNVTPLLLKG